MVHRKAVLLVALALTVGGSVAGCGSSDSGGSGTSGEGSKEPFKVLQVGALSGQLSAYGTGQSQALEAAAQYVNDNGGMAGHPVEVKSVDSGGDPGAAVSTALKEIAAYEPNMVFAGSYSTETAALMPVMKRSNQFAMAQTDGPNNFVGDASTNFPLQFSSTAGTTIQAESAAKWMKERGVKKVGVLEAASDLAKGGTETISAALDEVGIPYTVVPFPATATDLSPQFGKLRSQGVDMVWAEALGPAVGYVLSGREKLGWDVPIAGDLSFAASNFSKIATPEQLKDVYIQVIRAQQADEDWPGLDTFKEYWDKKGSDIIATTGILNGTGAWDALIAAAAAADAAGSIEPEAMARAMEDLPDSDSPFASVLDVGFTSDVHQNTRATVEDYPIVTPGELNQYGQVQSETPKK